MINDFSCTGHRFCFRDTHILHPPKNFFLIHMTTSFNNLHQHLRSSTTLRTFKFALSKHLFLLNWVLFPWLYFDCFLFWFLCTSGRTSSDDGCCNKNVYIYTFDRQPKCFKISDSKITLNVISCTICFCYHF